MSEGSAGEAADVRQLRALLTGLEQQVHFHVRALDWAESSSFWELWSQDPGVPLEAFVAACGLGVAGAPVGRWEVLTRHQAQRLLLAALAWEQAYDTARLELSAAERIATAFVDLFAPDARFFTNGTVQETSLGLRTRAWYGSVTSATFETGVVVVDARRIGLLYVADED